jgi:hypothetical protein
VHDLQRSIQQQVTQRAQVSAALAAKEAFLSIAASGIAEGVTALPRNIAPKACADVGGGRKRGRDEAGVASHGRQCHFQSPLHVSLVVLRTK